MDDSLDEFRALIRRAEQEGGNILIPAFAVGRTQELLFQLGQFYQEGLLDNWRVFLDSPMGHAVTAVYAKSTQQLDPWDMAVITDKGNASLLEFLPNLTVTASVEDSIAINKISSGAIIIAGSGMCTGGRIRHHFKHRLWEPGNHVVFAGFQAQGTLGRILVDGASKVKLFGQWVAVKAGIHTIGGFSAHAGQRDLLAWASAIGGEPQFYLIHGELDSMTALAEALEQHHGIVAKMPARGDIIEL